MSYDLIGFDGTRSTTQAVDLDMIFLMRLLDAAERAEVKKCFDFASISRRNPTGVRMRRAG